MLDGDMKLHQYQDDLNTDDLATDPIMNEETDDPSEMFQVPPEELRDELEKMDFDGEGEEYDDMRETIEDRDQDSNLKDRW